MPDTMIVEAGGAWRVMSGGDATSDGLGAGDVARGETDPQAAAAATGCGQADPQAGVAPVADVAAG